jgi:hypothetical protein
MSDGGEGSPERLFEEDGIVGEVGGGINEMGIADADLIKDTKHGLRIRLRDLKALRRSFDGATSGLDPARRGLDGAISSFEEALATMGDALLDYR